MTMHRAKQIKFLVFIGVLLIVTVGIMCIIIATVVKPDDEIAVFDTGGRTVPPIAKTTVLATTTPKVQLPIINTECGKVQGLSKTVITDNNETKIVYKYIGIPYAVPPVKDLRWRPPVRLSDDKSKCWKGIMVANKNIFCKQHNYFTASPTTLGQEDCLVLSVRTPTRDVNAKLPVLVWVHGGALLFSKSESFGYSPNSQLVASMNIVSVSMNYRLGPFGFIVIKELMKENGRNISYGNLGYMDQILSLKWIKDNIAKFGGDPNRVTLFGHSAGGAAVNALISSPLAKNLFKRVISSSSVITPPSYKQAMNEHRSFVYKSNCNKSTAMEIRTCLYNLSDNQVIAASPWTINYYTVFKGVTTFPNNSYSRAMTITTYTDPIVYPSVVPYNESNIKQVLLTSTAQESAIFAPAFVGANGMSLMVQYLKPRMESFSANDLFNKSLSMYPAIGGSVTPEYIYHTMTTDVLTTCDTNKYGEILSKFFDVYRYVLSQPPSNPMGRLSHHAVDTSAFFGHVYLPPGFTPKNDDWLLTKNLRNIFGQFIKTGTTSDSWRKYPNVTAEYLNNTLTYIQEEYHKKQCLFWEKYGLLGRFGPYQ